MNLERRLGRDSLTNLIEQVDTLVPGSTPPDTVPTGFPSLDRALGGGLRRRDLTVLGGDVGSGKSALALAMALRAAQAGYTVAFLSGEMDEDRLLERALALQARVQIDDIRSATVPEAARAALGAAAIRLRELPLKIHAVSGDYFDHIFDALLRHDPALIVVDYLQLLPAPHQRPSLEEEWDASVRALKVLALKHAVSCLAVAQLPRHSAERADRRPTLDDFGAVGAVKQHADVVMGLYREEMYDRASDVVGATELIVAKNRNGPTGFIDLYFHQQWLRFEDMLDPES
jgi:replicative DNA helicase